MRVSVNTLVISAMCASLPLGAHADQYSSYALIDAVTVGSTGVIYGYPLGRNCCGSGGMQHNDAIHAASRSSGVQGDLRDAAYRAQLRFQHTIRDRRDGNALAAAQRSSSLR